MDLNVMKCEQYLCINHTAIGCGFNKCYYFTGLHNEINAAWVEPYQDTTTEKEKEDGNTGK